MLLLKKTLLTPSDSFQKPSSKQSPTMTRDANTSVTTNAEQFRHSLHRLGLPYCDEPVKDKCPELNRYLQSTVLKSRGSIISDTSMNNIKGFRAEHKTSSENNYWPGAYDLMVNIGKPRLTQSTKHPHDEDELKTEMRKFADDGLSVKKQRKFTAKNLPVVDVAWSEPGVKDADPDFYFGTTVDPSRLAPPVVLNRVNVGPETDHAFFCVECDGPDKPIEKAINQCIGDGATMVAATRCLVILAETGRDGGDGMRLQVWPGEVDGLDTTSIAFTMAWSPKLAELYVHYANITRGEDGGKKEVNYEMAMVDSYSFDSPRHGQEEIKLFRQHFRSVLDWGIGARKRDMDLLMHRVKKNFIEKLL